MNTKRRALPNRRRHDVLTFEHGLVYTAGIGYFENGDVAEIFLNTNKADSDLDVNARDAAIAVSIALQYGVPIKSLYMAMTKNPNGTPSGPLGHVLKLLIKEGNE